MKKFITFLSLFLLAGFVSATSQRQYKDTLCNGHEFIYVQDSYFEAFEAGEYYFMSDTWQLPLTVYYYPEDESVKAPYILLDLTCQMDGKSYDDEKVADMISHAQEYHLEFPMVEELKKEYDENGKLRYRITYDVNYRNMLYGQGVTYSVPAYVYLICYGSAEVEIVSRSVASRCRDYVNTLPMNASLKFVPEDSESIYLWQIGEWIDLKYRFKWESNGNMTMVDGKDCLVGLDNGYMINKTIFPTTFVMDRSIALEQYMEKHHQSDFYVRVYPEEEGILTIEEYKEISHIKEIQLAGVKAAIDTAESGRLQIVAVLPEGSVKKTVLQEALKNANNPSKESYIIYEGFNGETLKSGNASYTYYQLGDQKYYTSTVTIAAAEGNTDATLQSVSIDGIDYSDFDRKVLSYYEVEVNTENPVFAAVTTSDKASYKVTSEQTVPGKVTIEVTAEAGNTLTYTFNVIAGRSSDATLKNIWLDGKPLIGFESGELYYRVEVTKIPQVTAEVNDPKSKLEILPVKTLPGYSTIIVTSERGNQLKYSINFALDNTLKTCAQNTDSLVVGKLINVVEGEDQVRLFPVRDLSIDSAFVRLMWMGAQELQIVVATTCDYSREDIEDNIIDTITLVSERGYDNFKYDLRPQDLKAYNRLSADGNVYMKIIGSQTGVLVVEEFEEDCLTRSNFFELGEQYNVTNRSFSDMYKVYAPDWRNHDVKFTWSGLEPLRLWFGTTCNFNLNEKSSLVIKPVLNFESGEEVVIEKTESEMKDYLDYEENNFIFARLQCNGNGVLKTEVVKKQDIDTKLNDIELFSARGEQGRIVINSVGSQQMSIYSVSGVLLWNGMVIGGERTMVELASGLYIVKGVHTTKKVIVE